MELINPKVIAAISGAIRAYEEEREPQKVTQERLRTQVEAPNLWGIAGRQDMMLQRKLWQLRLFK